MEIKKEHKTMAVTVVVALVVIAVISNVDALEKVKDTIFGKSGWF